ncbi:E1 [Boa constrictor papillomavirus 1]|uniref:E1 n=1 Tax=Boa constrictor papillomavirus 1 TaxID=2294156 RepID=UPI000E335E57|nr:E1 [Boa constrictor papillomavirus 1]AXL96272.1 E1 [Boa constrictor papillomavirus 1]
MEDKGIASEFVLLEAECSDTDSDEIDEGTDVEILNENVDVEVDQGNSLSLFVEQCNADVENHVHWLKRKYSSPKPKTNVDCLSPRMSEIHISPVGQTAKRRLFGSAKDTDGDEQAEAAVRTIDSAVDSGVEQTQGGISDIQCSLQNEIENPVEDEGQVVSLNVLDDILNAYNRKAVMYGSFKEIFQISFTELTRTFKSERTCSSEWVVAVYGAQQALYETMQTLIQEQCIYMHLTYSPWKTSSIVLALLTFKAIKCRDTVQKLFKMFLNVPELQILAEPPNVRSLPAALFWFKSSLYSTSKCDGTVPEWITRQTQVKQAVEQSKFDFSTMVQHAYDNDLTDESTIAYEYAKMADTDSNAAAFLASASQAKYVRDCATMVRHYKRAEMRNVSMSQWIKRRCDNIPHSADWKVIARLLKTHKIIFLEFVQAMKIFLKGIPKKNCILFYGPPNTGKSMFCMSLIKFFGGRVLSFSNSKSHFWLQPLSDCKLALIDDVTRPCLDYIDTYLRNALDGNPICIDCKHKAPMQIKCPPILLTSNIDILGDDRYQYLHSRVMTFNFCTQIPETDINVFSLTDEHWKSFFTRLQKHLELSEEEEESDSEENGNVKEAFRCNSRRPT